LCITAIATVLVGCNSADETRLTTSTSATATSGEAYLLTSEPEGAKTVLEARETARDEDEIVVLGRIGGSVDPWIAGRAAFSIVDPSLKACSDIPGDTCQTPWDYCCDPNLAAGTALVKVVDASGNVVKAAAKDLLEVKELDTVVVRGKAQRDDEGNLTVLATGIFVQK
jgi:hypothetical protein